MIKFLKSLFRAKKETWIPEVRLVSQHTAPVEDGVKVDPFGTGFRSYRAFMAWAEAFENELTLDGLPVKGGRLPSIPFVCKNDGSIALK